MNSNLEMPSWLDGNLLGFDTETTGISTARDRIATVSLIERNQDEDTVHNWVINPGVPMPPKASEVNGLTDEYLQKNGVAPEVGLEEVAQRLSDAMLARTPVVGFNVVFDIKILESELARHGLATLRARLGTDPFPVIDPLVLDRSLDRYRRGKRRLANVCAAYELPPRQDFHTAEADVSATLDLLGALLRRYPEIGKMSLEELAAYQRQAHRDWAESLTKYRQSQNPQSSPIDSQWL